MYIGRGIDSIDNISTLDNLTFNGSDATFNLTQNSVAFVPVSADALQIQIDGVIQSGNYTVSGSTVTFDFTPSGSSVCNGIRHFGVGLLTTVSDGAVTEAKIGTGAVTNAKLGADSVNGSKIADDSISDEHLDITAITGQTAITSLADTDKFLVSDASDSGNLKYIENQYLGGGAWTLLSTTDLSSGVAEFLDRDFFTTYSSYKHFKIDLQFIAPNSTADVRFVWQDASGDVTGDINAAWKANRNNASDEDGGQNATSNSNGVTLFQGSNSTGQGVNMILELWQPVGNASGNINMMWRAQGWQVGYHLFVTGGGTSMSGSNATGFVIKRASGDLTQSSNYSYIKIYGVKST